MRTEELRHAIHEAERFLKAAHGAISAIKEQTRVESYYHGGPATARARRASMDLTRALALLRRTPVS
jgi:hypothetical protein